MVFHLWVCSTWRAETRFFAWLPKIRLLLHGKAINGAVSAVWKTAPISVPNAAQRLPSDRGNAPAAEIAVPISAQTVAQKPLYDDKSLHNYNRGGLDKHCLSVYNT